MLTYRDMLIVQFLNLTYQNGFGLIMQGFGYLIILELLML